jgi:hypothetical protein
MALPLLPLDAFLNDSVHQCGWEHRCDLRGRSGYFLARYKIRYLKTLLFDCRHTHCTFAFNCLSFDGSRPNIKLWIEGYERCYLVFATGPMVFTANVRPSKLPVIVTLSSICFKN